MTVSAQTTYNIAIGNGVTTAFPYQFKILSASDLQVYVAGALKILNVDYSVSGVGADVGGSVTFLLGAPAALATVSLIRAMTVKRTTDYQQLGDFLTPVVNPDFDNAILLIQDVQTQLGRSIRTPADEVATLPTLPALSTRAGKFMGFDSGGLPVALTGTGNDSALRTDLASTALATIGSRLVGFITSLVGGIARTVLSKLSERVSVKDFGAVGDGATDDTAAFQAAINSGALRILIPQPSVAYKITAQLNMATNRSIKLEGDGWGWTSGGSFVGGSWIDFDCATVGASLFDWAGFIQGFEMCGLAVRLKQGSKNQRVARFAAILQGSIYCNRFEGTSTALDTNTALEFKNPTLIGQPFSGSVRIFANNFTNLQKAITLANACTTFRIYDNEIYGNNPAAASLIAISLAAGTIGAKILMNVFQGWATTAIDDDGTSQDISHNYFENNVISYDRSGASLPIAIGNMIVSGGSPVLPATAQATIEIRSRNWQIDDTAPAFGLGYFERYRTVKLGDLTTYAPAYTGSSTLTFTGVTSTTIRYTLKGNTLKVQWLLSGTIGGAGAELRIALPAGATAVGRCRNVVFNFEGAAQKFGVAEVQNGDAFIRVFKDSAVSGNWGAGAGETYGELELLVSGV